LGRGHLSHSDFRTGAPVWVRFETVMHALMPLSSNEDLTVILSFQDHFEMTTLVNPQVGYVNRNATRIIATLSFHSRSWKLKALPTDDDFALTIEASSATLDLGGSTYYDPLYLRQVVIAQKYDGSTKRGASQREPPDQDGLRTETTASALDVSNCVPQVIAAENGQSRKRRLWVRPIS